MPALGDVVPPLQLEGVDGKTHSLDFPKGSKTVLLFFLSGCPVCHRMIPEWNRAYKSKPAGLDVEGILMDKEPPGFFILTPIEFPVLRSPGRSFLDKLKVQRAPTMVRVGPGGKIEDAAIGEIDRMRLTELFRP
jgi:peroxiredoxin